MNHETAIIVLGGNYEENDKSKSNPESFLRLKAASFLYKKDPQSIIVSSGSGYSKIMKKELIKLGVPSSKIIEENGSLTTYHQLIRLIPIITRMELKEFSIITNAFHIPRTLTHLEYSFPLQEFYKSKKYEFISAEKITKTRVTISKEVQQNEKRGIKQIKNGTYKFTTFIIAEMSANHGHDIKKAYKIIDEAAKAGADAVKLQTYTPDTITINSDKKYFQIKVNAAWKGQTLYSLYGKAYTPWGWQPKLKKYAESKGLICFSTPFDNTAVDFLEKMNMPLYKVASFEVVDIPLLKRIGETKKPVIISRGMSSLPELKLAIKTLKESGCPSIAILHCISSYPAEHKEMNLKTIPDLSKKFKTVVGISDHSLGITVPISSVSLGASIIEKHITLSRKDGGPDATFSLEPHEFKNLVDAVRNTEASLGKPFYGPGSKESENIIFRKSLFVVENIKKGQKLTAQNIRSIRPGHGLESKYYDRIIGKLAKINLEKGTPLKLNHVKNV